MPVNKDWKEHDCKIESVDTRDYYDDKDNKHWREITISKKCQLTKRDKIKENKSILTMDTLKRMIEEEIDIFVKDKNNRKNKKSLDEDELDEICGDNISGQRLHNRKGEFASYKDNVSWSLQNKGCGASSMRPGSKVRRATRLPCGSVARKKGMNRRCYDGKDLPLEHEE